jgi:hypothetical protein
MIDQMRRAAIGERLMSDESLVEGRPGEEVNRQFNVGVVGYFAAVAGIGEHLSHRLAASLGEPDVHVAQRWFLFCGIDEGGHQPG